MDTVQCQNTPAPLPDSTLNQSNHLDAPHTLDRPGPEIMHIAGEGVIRLFSPATRCNKMLGNYRYIAPLRQANTDFGEVTRITKRSHMLFWKYRLQTTFGLYYISCDIVNSHIFEVTSLASA